MSATLNTNLEFAPEKPVTLEASFKSEPPPISVRDDSSATDGSVFVRYLERRANPRGNFPLLGKLSAGSDGTLAFGKLQGGYGKVCSEISSITRSRNGTRREEPSFLYLKTTFQF